MGRGEARRSLWIMLDTVRGVGTSLLNEDHVDDGGDRGVYFDCEYVFPRDAAVAYE